MARLIALFVCFLGLCHVSSAVNKPNFLTAINGPEGAKPASAKEWMQAVLFEYAQHKIWTLEEMAGDWIINFVIKMVRNRGSKGMGGGGSRGVRDGYARLMASAPSTVPGLLEAYGTYTNSGGYGEQMPWEQELLEQQLMAEQEQQLYQQQMYEQQMYEQQMAQQQMSQQRIAQQQ